LAAIAPASFPVFILGQFIGAAATGLWPDSCRAQRTVDKAT
jgi:hypothetical protein